jgi:hypothetical protein
MLVGRSRHVVLLIKVSVMQVGATDAVSTMSMIESSAQASHWPSASDDSQGLDVESRTC